jgi:deoxyinosine 3'endonuclease (endonuclease V)
VGGSRPAGGNADVAGLDAAFVLMGPQALGNKASRWERLREANQAIGCAVVYRILQGKGVESGVAVALEEIERACAVVPLKFPYIPGLLSSREIPALLAALGKWKAMPDVLFCDGQGYAHPRRFGLAAHLGVAGGSERQGADWGRGTDEGWSAVVYVSQGNRVSLQTAIRMTLAANDARGGKVCRGGEETPGER